MGEFSMLSVRPYNTIFSWRKLCEETNLRVRALKLHGGRNIASDLISILKRVCGCSVAYRGKY